MEINTDALSVHEMFGYKTEKDMLDNATNRRYAKENKKEISLIAASLGLQEIGAGPTMLLLSVVSATTGLDLQTPSDLFDYFNKSLTEKEMITLSAEIVMIRRLEFGNEDEDALRESILKDLHE